MHLTDAVGVLTTTLQMGCAMKTLPVYKATPVSLFISTSLTCFSFILYATPMNDIIAYT